MSLVSIVIPIFKPDINYFSKMMESIFAQTFTNFEIVISNDENSLPPEVETLLKKYTNISFICVQNNSGIKGIFGNLNNAINYSKGKYIQIFCQDDIMYSTFIENQVERFSNDAVGLVFSNFDFVTEQGNCFPLESKHDHRKTWPETILKNQFGNYLLINGCMPGNLSPVMITRESFDLLGPFNQDISYAGDFDYWTRFSNRYDVAYNNSPLLAVRRHELQASATVGLEQLFKDRQYIYNRLFQQSDYKKRGHLKCFLNQEIGVPQTFLFIKGLLSRKKGSAPLRKWLNKPPFHFTLSFMLMLLTINGRIKLWRLDIINLNNDR